MDAIIISVGTELVTGQCVDTNSAWLAARLSERGVATIEHQTIGDDPDRLAVAIRRAMETAAIVILTGGLGPTLDDITRDAIAAALGVPLHENIEALGQIEAFFQRLGRTMTDSNRRQALVPQGCGMIPNPRGTAPGIYGETVKRRNGETSKPLEPSSPKDQGSEGSRDQRSGGSRVPESSAESPNHPIVQANAPGLLHKKIDGFAARTRLWALPGVPSEMKALFEASIAPALTPASGGRSIMLRRLHCFGITEARLGEQIADLMARGRNPNVGTTASGAVLTIRIVSEADSPSDALQLAESDVAEVRRRLAEIVFGEEDESLQSAVAGMLIAQRKTVATAESCTGGLLAQRLTETAGSSAYFLSGFVTYSDGAKVAELGVAKQLIQEHGAVSEAVAAAMATGCRAVAGSNYAISITGIAGPTGGSPEKPVGLVYIALADGGGAKAKRFTFGEHLSRTDIRDRAAKSALNMLRLRLLTAR